VALLNSKNSWRILGQESFSFEIAQDFDYEVKDKAVVLPIGNAGNITAVMSGFLKFYRAGIIKGLPRIVGVQSEHADPVYRYYLEEEEAKRSFVPVTVKPSVAQAAMIGNPVSMPRVIQIARAYNQAAGEKTDLRGSGDGAGDHGFHDDCQPEWKCSLHAGRGIHGRLQESD